MIRELKKKIAKYMEIGKRSEYVNVAEIINDLSYLLREARIKRLPKDER